MIREMKEQDIERIYELGILLHENFKKTYELEKMIKEPYFKIFVYEDKKKILGFISYVKVMDSVDLLDLIVDPKHRRKHIATNLMDYMITNLKPEDKIYLEVSVHNEAAIHLYENFGFEKIHTREKYYGEEDAYVMERVMFGE